LKGHEPNQIDIQFKVRDQIRNLPFIFYY